MCRHGIASDIGGNALPDVEARQWLPIETGTSHPVTEELDHRIAELVA